MRRWKLTTRVYVGLAVLTAVTTAVAIWQWDEPWARDWLPNFIAEWSGLFIAVAIVDRLLSRAREAEVAASRAPERRLAGSRLERALEQMVDFAVHDYARRFAVVEGDEAEPAAVFFERWSQTLLDSASARQPEWLRYLAETCRQAVDDLTTLRAEYEVALDPI